MKRNKTMVKKTTIMNRSNNKGKERLEEEFKNFEPPSMHKAETNNKKDDFYEVDLSEEENRKDKKSV
eukprot:CAMPEP_0205801078 /NCGR_PEP_ID=MMETSP0205-20121125/2949_1 /ASSEMBLY_ACC=CAM_ASM_000278 /TAXON_ID=36767 /ORGANISM="Euplotes focardii, Strain TN1" /LENGTH=66 /DNA_ID=CAMNT_0053065231 /DNA_START=722 /DNA_END=919 /DNA_ORIENTATION=+